MGSWRYEPWEIDLLYLTYPPPPPHPPAHWMVITTTWEDARSQISSIWHNQMSNALVLFARLTRKRSHQAHAQCWQLLMLIISLKMATLGKMGRAMRRSKQRNRETEQCKVGWFQSREVALQRNNLNGRRRCDYLTLAWNTLLDDYLTIWLFENLNIRLFEHLTLAWNILLADDQP